MIYIRIVIGAALLAYPVYAAIGLGLSLCVFFGIFILMSVIRTWFIQTRNNSKLLSVMLAKGFENGQVSRDISNL